MLHAPLQQDGGRTQHAPARKVETEVKTRELHVWPDNELGEHAAFSVQLEVVVAVVERCIPSAGSPLSEIHFQIGFNVHRGYPTTLSAQRQPSRAVLWENDSDLPFVIYALLEDLVVIAITLGAENDAQLKGV
jgi:hypothetical protein